MERILEATSTDTLMSLFGSFDANVKLIEREMGVRITNKDTQIKIIGDNCDKAAAVISRLIDEIEIGETLNEQNIRYAIFSVNEDIEYVPPAKGDYICITAKGKSVKCKTHGQKNYIQKIRDNTVVIAIGPAGTGKTYLAVAMAVDAFRRKEVSRIILTRPAVEAGEKLGFLPGDL
jgi:phosphate starvation-inducible PhoH-like protein